MGEVTSSDGPDTLQRISTMILASEVEELDRLAAELPRPYTGNRAAIIRELLREALEARAS